MIPKNKEMLLSVGVFITLTISFMLMFYFFITSFFAASINPIIDPQIWWDNRYMYTACLLISSVVYIAPLLLQYLLVKDRLPKKKTFFREYITISNTLFIILVVSFIMFSLVAWYRSGSVPITGPTGHSGADVRYFRSALFSRVTDLIIPITLTVVGIILSMVQYFQLRSSSVKNKSVTPK